MARSNSLGLISAATVALAAMTASTAMAQVDNLRVIVDTPNASDTNSLGSYGYDPATNSIFTATYGSGGAVRRITNVDGTETSTIQVSESQTRLFYTDGDTDRGVSVAIQSGIVLNPKEIVVDGVTYPAYSFAIINDSGSTYVPATSRTIDPAATKRVYRYNLQAVDPLAQAPAHADGRDVYTTLVTLSDMGALHGNSANTSSNAGRQGAFSSDGKSFYFVDSSSTNGGIYRTNAITGQTSLVLDRSGVNTEPGVLPLSGGGDRILYQGSTGNNEGGLNVLSDNGSTPVESVFLSAQTLADFLERPVGDASVRSVATDAQENVYFYDSDSDALLRMDALGRLSKLTTRAERTAFRDELGKTGTVNANILRLQTRTITDATAGPITQVLYAEQTKQNYVAGVNAYAAGDFDRDGELTDADIDLFKSALTLRGVAQTNSGNFKFDMNGNTAVDWKDVKILQGFFDIGDGDVNLDGLVDFTDFRILRDHFNQIDQTYVFGDLTGDDQVTLPDFRILEANYGFRSNILGLNLTPEPFVQSEWNDFLATVPEPSLASLLVFAGAGLFMRRRRQDEREAVS